MWYHREMWAFKTMHVFQEKILHLFLFFLIDAIFLNPQNIQMVWKSSTQGIYNTRYSLVDASVSTDRLSIYDSNSYFPELTFNIYY